jgi:hypothetical protein
LRKYPSALQQARKALNAKAIGIYNRNKLFLGLGWSFFDFAILPSVLLVRTISALDQQHHQERETFQRKATHEVDRIPPTRTETQELRRVIPLFLIRQLRKKYLYVIS